MSEQKKIERPAYCQHRPCSYCRRCDYCPMSQCREAKQANAQPTMQQCIAAMIEDPGRGRIPR